ncbi:MAG: hypothetical protein GF334_04665, partial [Candidatus Altiarchaeales archaeon]|nr:hypothetical protein [Candidatus Altiarchaeales archaeon]
MDEELRLRKLAAKGDAVAQEEAVRLARRRGEKLVLVLDDDGGILERL